MAHNARWTTSGWIAPWWAGVRLVPGAGQVGILTNVVQGMPSEDPVGQLGSNEGAPGTGVG